jgi:hypothetical protein
MVAFSRHNYICRILKQENLLICPEFIGGRKNVKARIDWGGLSITTLPA